MFNLSNFYRSPEWKKLRLQIMLERVNTQGDIICEHCDKPIVNKYDCIAHHVRHLTEENVNDLSTSLNADNIILVHHKCHNEIHNRFGAWTRHIYIVYGSPCSGKSFYVDSVATPDDLIIDIDRLYIAINNARSDRVYNNVMMLYRQLIDIVKTRNGRWVNAYIVRGLPGKGERERLAAELDAELVFIDTNKETCLKRSKEKSKDYYKFVDDWFLKYQK